MNNFFSFQNNVFLFKINKTYRFIISLFSLLLFNQPALAQHPEWRLNLPYGASEIAHKIYNLHMGVVYSLTFIALLIFIFLFFSLFRYRQKKNPQPACWSSNMRVEIMWWIIPTFILAIIAIPATYVLLYTADYEQPDMTIKITGKQWKWHYSYLDNNLAFYSNLSTPQPQQHNQAPKGVYYLREVDEPLVLPTHTKVRLLLTSTDVIHSWWVSELGFKKDALPGIITEMWVNIDTPGTYRGQCAELCGIGHAFMPIVVHALNEQDFKQWLIHKKEGSQQILQQDQQTYALNQLLTHGEQVYMRNCAVCHQPNGNGLPPRIPPLRGSSVETGEPISRHIDIVLNGVSGSLMQSFSNQLSDYDIAAVVTYERNAWTNNTSDLVQPHDITERKAYWQHQPNNVASHH